MPRIFISILVLYVFSLQASSQCSIRDLVVTPSACEENTFTVSIDFLFNEVSDSFKIQGNGNDYGFFAYTDLPVQLGPFNGDCQTPYEFVIRDKADPECSTFNEAGVFCCEDLPCEINIRELSAGRCTETGIIVQFDLDTQGVAGLGFDVFSGDEFIGFYTYDQLPLTLNNFPSSGTATERITVCENDDPACCDTMVFESTCGCGIFDIDIDVVECDEEGNTFYAKVDFIPQMTSDSFFLGGNNTTYGTFAYADLPVFVGPLAFSETIEYEFLILDRESSVCFNFYDLGIVSSCNTIPCDIDDVIVMIEDCTPNGIFYANLSFDYNGMVADSFMIVGNGNNYGTFAYGLNDYRIGPIEGDCERILEFGVVDKQNEECRNFVVLQEPVCCQVQCEISEVRIDIDECLSDGSFYVDLLFNYSGMVSDSFTIRGSGLDYGTFAYGGTSYRLGPLEGDCETIYEFVVRDKSNEECSGFTFIEGPICCALPCPLNDIGAEVNCNDETLVIEVATNDSGEADVVLIYFNGLLWDEVGYEMFPYIIPLNDDITFPLLIEAVDPINMECIVETEIQEGCAQACEIGELKIEFLECDNDNRAYFSVDFDHNLAASDVFEVLVDNESVGFFTYGSLPVNVGPINIGEESLGFIVKDLESSECLQDKRIDAVSCTSSLEELNEMGIEIISTYGNIVINNHQLIPFELSIHAINGQSIYRGSMGNILEINTLSWRSGIYLAHIRMDKKVYLIKLFVP